MPGEYSGLSKFSMLTVHWLSVQPFEEWAAPRIQTFPLSAIKDARIGVDASYYLDQRLNKKSNEPLLHALGGFPYALKKLVEEDVQYLKKLDISLVFVFNGLDFRNREQPASQSSANRKAHEDGWQHYLGGDPDKTVTDFGRASKKHKVPPNGGLSLTELRAYPVEMLYKYLQKLLLDQKVEFMVAPYSAAAQVGSYHVVCPPEANVVTAFISGKATRTIH